MYVFLFIKLLIMNNQGTKIRNAVYGLRNSNNNFTFVVINNPSGEFLPCGEHPGSESFDDCFARQWNDFCWDMVGCVTLATHPIAVATLIAIHCIICG